MADSPLTLVLPVTPLDLLMLPFLDLPFQNSCSSWLVECGDLENVGGIDIVIVASAHDMVSADIVFEHWNLKSAVDISIVTVSEYAMQILTPLYVAEQTTFLSFGAILASVLSCTCESRGRRQQILHVLVCNL